MSKIVEKTIINIEKNSFPSLFEGELFELKLILDKNKIIQMVKSQQEKGLKKYGHTIDECPNDKYNWTDMAYEEIADFLIYKQKFINSINED